MHFFGLCKFLLSVSMVLTKEVLSLGFMIGVVELAASIFFSYL